ncbi:MAG: hypothetical protein KU37_03765 [Sulfuricurvum sp. PC08-66]|nr:MAG: hypothetical protein KU37_03765 [Sulfuricurvum sp. PC08-66]
MRLLLLLLPLLLWGESIQQRFGVPTQKPQRLLAAPTMHLYGYAKTLEQEHIDIAPRFGGFVTQLWANERYIEVKKGDKLALIYSPDVLQAKEDYINALNFQDGKHDSMIANSLEKLHLLGIDPKEITALSKSSKASAYTTLYAPKSGTLYAKTINEGSAFTKGTTLFSIVDTRRLYVDVAIFASQLAQAQKLSTFTLTLPNGTKRTATLDKLLPIVNPKEAIATLRLLVDNSDSALLDGMLVTLEAKPKEREVLLIPRSAAIHKKAQWYCFVAGEYEGEYEPRAIELAPFDAQHYEVLGGIDVDTAIVTHALFMRDADAQINGLYP